MNKINLLVNREEQTISRLLDIWESAIEKTHTFLSNEDIVQIKWEVQQALKTIEQLYGFYDDSNILQGFIGVEHCKIEMLFIHDHARGKGMGKHLLKYAVETLDAKFVDVNEQNEQGVGFYKHMGFHIINRSEYDEQDRPFPILHLEF